MVNTQAHKIFVAIPLAHGLQAVDATDAGDGSRDRVSCGHRQSQVRGQEDGCRDA